MVKVKYQCLVDLNLLGMIKIKDLPLNERPREKALKYGISSLSNAELLAVIISSGYKNVSALDLSYNMLSRFGSIQGLANLTIDELLLIKGISLAKAIRLLATFDLLKRYENELNEKKIVLNDSLSVMNMILPKCIGLKQEVFYLVLLNKKKELIRIEKLYKGTNSSLSISPSDIITTIVKAGASKAYICHNHPSNVVTPSKPDIETFQTLTLFLGTISIDLIDSIIIGENECYSCVEEKIYQNKKIFS